MQTLDGGTLDPYYDDMLNWYHHNIPIPPTVWLFGSGLMGIFGVKKANLKKIFSFRNGGEINSQF